MILSSHNDDNKLLLLHLVPTAISDRPTAIVDRLSIVCLYNFSIQFSSMSGRVVLRDKIIMYVCDEIDV